MKKFNEILIILGAVFAIIMTILIPISLIFWQPVDKITAFAIIFLSNTVILSLIGYSTKEFNCIDKINTVYLTVLYTINILDIILLICT